jgi:hypothetical protein
MTSPAVTKCSGQDLTGGKGGVAICSAWVQTANALAAIAIRKSGPSRAKFRHCHRLSTHQAHKQSTTGKMTVEVLLVMASAAKINVSA